MSEQDERPAQKVRKVLLGASALAAAVRVEIDEAHPTEVDRVSVLGIPVFSREPEKGRPRVFGITFPRWMRGPR